MEMINVNEEISKVQGVIDGIIRNGFWFGVFFDDDESLMFHPYRLEVLGAKPEVGLDGKVKAWVYAILMIDRGFADFGASVHGNHLHFVERIEWFKNKRGRIYAARLYDDAGIKVTINEIDAGEHPDLAEEWDAYCKKLKEMLERVNECLKTIRREFMEMVEARFR